MKKVFIFIMVVVLILVLTPAIIYASPGGTDGPWDVSWGTNRWQVMDVGGVMGWYQNKPVGKGLNEAKYFYPLDYTYGYNGHEILDMLTEKLGENAMNGHYKFGLSSSVLEEFALDMNDGILDGRYFIETVTVPANKITETPSSNPLVGGITYILEAHGTWINSQNVTDTEYASKDGWTTWMDGYDIAPWFLGVNEFDLMVDGAFIDWGTYSPTHDYTYSYPGTGNPVKFLIFDGDSTVLNPVPNPGWYGDNSGNLTVDIYAQL